MSTASDALARHGAISGTAIFLRRDKADFREEEISFETMEELFRLCLETRDHLSLQRIVLRREMDRKPCMVKLEFVSSSDGKAPKQKAKSA